MKTMKKWIVSIAFAMVLVLSFSGCGNVVPAMNEQDSGKFSEEATEMIGDSTSPDEIIADAGEQVEQNKKADKPSGQVTDPVETIAPVETEKPAQTAEPVATEGPAETEKPAVTEKPAKTEKPAATEKPAETAKPADNQAADASDVFVCDYCGYKTADFMECLVHVLGHEQAVPSEPAPSAPFVPSAQGGSGSEESKPAESEGAGSEQPHEHNWIAHTNQRWVSQIVTVVDEPERYEKYDEYGMYWYNTGEWEETRDPDRFAAWYHDREGGPTSERAARNEDNPLFLGYNEYGLPSFQGDHVIRTHYEYIPAVTHEEDQGYYETYVDYYYCDCGATKN